MYNKPLLKIQKIILDYRKFKSAIGKIINADINGAIGIMRKVVPNVIDKIIKGIEGVVVHPKLVTV